MTPPRPTEVVQVGEYGAAWELREPHTVESIRGDAARSQGRRPWLCRLGLHRRKVVGTPHLPNDDLVAAAVNVIATRGKSALTRCSSCGAIAERSQP